jgi:hypothetical protein
MAPAANAPRHYSTTDVNQSARPHFVDQVQEMSAYNPDVDDATKYLNSVRYILRGYRRVPLSVRSASDEEMLDSVQVHDPSSGVLHYL